MKTRIFLVAAALMLFASLGFGQGFNILINGCDFVMLGSTPTGCNGAPLADGTIIEIYQDVDNDGPDAEDPRPLVGDPNIPGTVNYDQFATNGTVYCGPEGTFYTDPGFTSYGVVPPNAHYYLRGPAANGWRLVSAVYHVVAPGAQDWVPTWTCVEAGGPPVCVPTVSATINAGGSDVPHNISVCLDLCEGFTTVVNICSPTGAPLDPTKAPISHVAPGCLTDGCDVQCDPAAGYVVTGPFYDATTGCWYYLVVGGAQNGCVCFTFEYFLAANIDANTFTAVAGDNMVTVGWTTLSEGSVNSFGVVRDGEVIGNVEATNSPSGSTYSYVDRSALNGTTYTYSLRVNNSDGSVTETGLEVSSTPSFGAAVITEYALHQNFPNPFNPTTSITFDVVEKNLVTLKVFNAAGQEVATVANGEFDGGRHVVSFSADNLTSGLYFYTVKIGNEFSATKKMLLVK